MTPLTKVEYKIRHLRKLFYKILFHAIILLLLIYSYKNVLTSSSVDYAGHYVLIKKILKDYSISEGYVGNLGEMIFYPPGSHFFASILSRFTGSIFLGINILNIAFLYFGYLSISKFLINKTILPILIFIIISAIIIDRGSAPIFGQEIIENFLFGQFISTSIFFISLQFLLKFQKFETNIFIGSLLLFNFLLFIHPTGAIIFIAGCGVYFLYLIISNGYIYYFSFPYLRLFLYCLLGSILFYYHPYTSDINKFKNYNGSLDLIFFSTNGEDLSHFGFFLIFLILSFNVVYLIKQKTLIPSHKMVILNCFSIGVSLLIAFQIPLYIYDYVSPYIIKKNIYILFTINLIIFSVIAEYYLLKRFTILELFKLKVNSSIAECTIGIFMLLFSWSHTRDNIEKIETYQNLTNIFQLSYQINKISHNTLALFSDLTMPMNWIITIANLEADKQGKLSAALVLNKLWSLEESNYIITNFPGDEVFKKYDNFIELFEYKNSKLGLYDAKSFFNPSISPNELVYQFNNTNNYSKRFIRNGFKQSDISGTWIDYPSSMISFNLIDYIKSGIKIGFGLYCQHNKNSQLKIIFIVNNEKNSEFLCNDDQDQMIKFEIKNLEKDNPINIKIEMREIYQFDDNTIFNFHRRKIPEIKIKSMVVDYQ